MRLPARERIPVMKNPLRVAKKLHDSLFMTFQYAINGVPQNLTGTTVRSQIRDVYGVLVGTLVFTLLTQSGNTLGLYTLELAGPIEFGPGEFFWDIEYTFTGGRISTVPEEGHNLLVITDDDTK